MTVWRSASSSIVSSHCAARPATPWMSTIGGPWPAMLKFTRWPWRRTSTRSIVGRARTLGAVRARRLGAAVAAVMPGRVLTDRSVGCEAAHEISRNLRTVEVALARQLAQPPTHRAVDHRARGAREEGVFDLCSAGGGQVAGRAPTQRRAGERPRRRPEALSGHDALEREAVLV